MVVRSLGACCGLRGKGRWGLKLGLRLRCRNTVAQCLEASCYTIWDNSRTVLLYQVEEL